jgi:hypothetical protein
MLQNNMADRGRVSKDAWFGGWLPVCAFQCGLRLGWLGVAALLTASLAFGVQRWERTYGAPGRSGDLYDVVQTADGGYLAAGSLDEFLWLVRVDSLGDTAWTQEYCPDEFGCRAHSVLLTADGGFVVAGFTQSYPSPERAYVMRADSLGDSLWTRKYAPPLGSSMAYDIEPTRDGGFIIVGECQTDTVRVQDAYVVRIDSLGDTLWTRRYGGVHYEEANCVRQTGDGGFIMTGWTGELFDHDGWLIRVDSLGDTLWTRTYGGRRDDALNSVELLPDGFVLAGWTNSYGAGSSDGWLLRLDCNGETLWSRTFGGLYSDAWAMNLAGDGGYIMTGQTFSYGAGASDAWLVSYDSGGAMRWMRTFGGTDWDYTAQAYGSSDGGYILAGRTLSFGNTWGDGYLIKTDKYGTVGVGADRGSPPIATPCIPLLEAPCPWQRGRSVRYFLPEAGPVKLDLSDVAGRRIEKVVQGHSGSGWHVARVESALASGTYFLRLESSGQFVTCKTVVTASVEGR